MEWMVLNIHYYWSKNNQFAECLTGNLLLELCRGSGELFSDLGVKRLHRVKIMKELSLLNHQIVENDHINESRENQTPAARHQSSEADEPSAFSIFFAPSSRIRSCFGKRLKS